MLIDTQVKEKYLFYTIISRRDEIGRRARLKIWWSLLRVGSTPTAGNKLKLKQNKSQFVVIIMGVDAEFRREYLERKTAGMLF